MSLDSQRNLGPYRLLNVIKTGQTSQVWSAINDRNQQRVAIKVLLSDYRTDKEQFALFKHEFEVGKKLDHPRVIHLYDFGQDRHMGYLVMEYYPFPNMKDMLLRGIEQYAPLMSQMISQATEGLGYFNDQGWVHRDIKPDNFLVSEQGEVRLIDFALAQRPAGALGRIFSRRQKVQGTRSYMSPEQIRGGPLDARADVYSLGCTIFHLLAGQPPFTGASSNELLNKHLTKPPPALEAANRNVTREFGDMIRSMMAKKPADRPKNAGEVQQRLRSLQIFKVPPKPQTAGA